MKFFGFYNLPVSFHCCIKRLQKPQIFSKSSEWLLSTVSRSPRRHRKAFPCQGFRLRNITLSLPLLLSQRGLSGSLRVTSMTSKANRASFYRSSPGPTICDCFRHGLQSRHLFGSSHSLVRRHLSTRSSCQHQGGVLQVQGGRERCHRLGQLSCWLRPSVLRRRCPDQCHGNNEPEGSCISWNFDLLG